MGASLSADVPLTNTVEHVFLFVKRVWLAICHRVRWCVGNVAMNGEHCVFGRFPQCGAGSSETVPPGQIDGHVTQVMHLPTVIQNALIPA